METKTTQPSKPSVMRLSLYRDAVTRFKSYAVQWVMSEEIASSLGIKAAQVRKDLSIFGISGKRKAGYQVTTLLEHFNRLLGTADVYSAILAGVGPLGSSLIREKIFSRQNIRILAAFDDASGSDDSIGRSLGVAVHPLADMIGFIKEHKVRFGVIASGAETAQRIADFMIIAGIDGILSLSPAELKAPAHVIVHTINVARELERVIYFANHAGARRRKPA